MDWNLRMAAAQRGIWRASELRRVLADAGLTISAGKMSYLWSGTPVSVRLDDLDVICAVLDCEPGDLLVRGDVSTPKPVAKTVDSSTVSAIRPSRRRRGRSLPPV